MNSKLVRSAALPLTAIVFLFCINLPRNLPVISGGFVPGSAGTHLAMAIIPLVLLLVFSNNRLDLCGFTMGEFRFKPLFLLWLLPTAIPSTLSSLFTPEIESSHPVSSFSTLQTIVFVWFLASIAEEFLVRGLFQSLVARTLRGNPTGKWYKLSLPVVLSGLFFGGMHSVLFKSMGLEAIPVIIMTSILGIIAAKYRETTGSIIPAILIHMMFNIGAQLPGWIF